MLGKLIKNDLKSTSRIVVYIYFSMLIAAAVFGVSLIFEIMVGRAVASLALIVISLIAVGVTIISVFVDFMRTMFGDRGYLTNSLPVTNTSLLFSKLFTSMIWIVISYGIFFASFFAVMVYNMEQTTGEFDIQMVWEFLPMLGMPSIDILKQAILVLAVKGIFQITVFVMVVQFAMTLSNVRPFSRLGFLGVIIYFVIIYGLLAFLGGQIVKLIDLNVLIYADGALSMTTNATIITDVKRNEGFASPLSQLIIQMLLSFVLFVTTSELLDKKVNIK